MTQPNDNMGNKFVLAKYRLDSAKETLSAAQVLFDSNFFKDANNRAYYAVFHAIDAVLAIEGIGFKRHKSVLAHFNKNYVKNEIFPKSIGHRISEVGEIREASDYHDFYLASKAEAEECIATAAELIPLVEDYISKQISES